MRNVKNKKEAGEMSERKMKAEELIQYLETMMKDEFIAKVGVHGKSRSVLNSFGCQQVNLQQSKKGTADNFVRRSLVLTGNKAL